MVPLHGEGRTVNKGLYPEPEGYRGASMRARDIIGHALRDCRALSAAEEAELERLHTVMLGYRCRCSLIPHEDCADGH